LRWLPKEAEGVKDAKMKGSAKAPITVVEFSDFQCPSCRFAQAPLKKLEEQFHEVLNLKFRHFPLSGHAYAMDAALSAECASEQGKFWPYHDLLFETQPLWSADPDAKTLFLALANELGLGREAFLACLGGEASRARVEEDRALGRQAQVQSTPTFFIGEERLVGAKQLEEKGMEVIRARLEALASKKGR
jgi:protein-disulfide isomerase